MNFASTTRVSRSGTTTRSIRRAMARATSDRSMVFAEPLERRTLLCGLQHFSPSVLEQDAALEHLRADAAKPENRPEGGNGSFNIEWTNRGTAGNDVDNFNAIFGDRAEAARNVVETVMQMWEGIIISMHDQGGRNQIDVDVYADSSVTGYGALARLVEAEYGFPVRGDIEIGNGTAGVTDRGWFIDDTPLQHSEFTGTIINAFAGDAQSGSPAENIPDLYTVVNAEIVHLLGITSSEDTFWTDPGFTVPTSVTDPFEGGGIGKLHYMQMPFNQLLTTYNSGGGGTDTGEPLHTSPGSLYVNSIVGSYFGSQDAGNAGYENGRRYLAPNNIARMLVHAYGYEIRDPELQATFYGALTDGNLLVRGDTGIDTIEVFRDFATNEIVVSVDLATDVPGTGPTDAFVTRYPADYVTSVNIAGGGGSDAISLNTNINLPTTVDLGTGNDKLSVRGKGVALGGTMAINVIGVDDGGDTLELIGERSGETVLVDAASVTHSGGFTLTDAGQFDHLWIDCHFGQTDIRVTRSGDFSDLAIFGSSDADTILLNELASNLPCSIYARESADNIRLAWVGAGVIASPVTVFGENGADTLELAHGDLGQLLGPVSFVPGANVDTIIFHDEHNAATSPVGANYGFTPQTITATRPSFSQSYQIMGVESVLFGGDTGDNHFTVAPSVSYQLQLFGNIGDDVFDGVGASAATLYGQDGNDEFILGNGNLAPGASLVAAFGEAGNDIITFDDHLSNGNLPWTINGQINGSSVQNRVFLGINEYGYVGFETVRILGNDASQEFRFAGVIGVGLDVDGGGGADIFTLGFQNAVVFASAVSLRGGFGSDSFVVNDAGVSAFTTLFMEGGNDFNSLTVNEPLPIGFTLGVGYFVAQGNGTFGYANMNTIVFNGNANDNVYTVYSAGISLGTITLNGNLGNDAFRLLPQPSGHTFEHLTLNGNQGNDTVTYDASALSSNESYTIGSSVLQRSDGPFSTESVSMTSMVSLALTCGAGNDTIAINEFTTGLGVTVNGGAGDDVCDFGGGNLPANITSIASFLFNGLEGTDTFNLRNADSPSSFTYTQASNTNLQTSRTSPTAYSLSLECFNTEQKVVYAGPAADVMNITSFASGELSFHGGGGDDTLNLPTSSDLIGRRVNFYGDGGTLNRITQTTNTKSAASVLHIFQNSIGAFPGDTFFAPGGSVYFDSVQTMALRLGSGADTAFIEPNPVARINLTGGVAPLPGDTLNLALASTQSPLFAGSVVSGSLSSANRATVTYSGFEIGPVIDDVEPAIILADINVNGIPGAGAAEGGSDRQSLDVQFSEDVSALLSTGSLQLTNATTGETIPTANTSVEYDSSTNTAHFTFPGYADGILPDGDYSGAILAGLPDSFGNALPADAPFTFFFLNGDANHDRSIDFADLLTLAQNYGQSSRTFSQGDFNYDGAVDFSDLLILAQRYGTGLALLSLPDRNEHSTRTRRRDVPSYIL